MFRKILVALDHSMASPALFDQALSMAQSMQADLMLVHVLSEDDSDSPKPPLYGASDGYPLYFEQSIWDTYNDSWNAYEQHGIERLQQYAATGRQVGVEVEFSQNIGHPGKTVCQVARSWGADLIWVGNRGRSGLSELLLGSVSNYVMHHAPCSVLVMHTTQKSSEKRIAQQVA